MARIRSINTRPELFIRSYFHKSGLRFRIHCKDLPGKPDIVFPSRKLAIFVNGCFWHMHEGCKRATIPSTRRDYWEQKLLKNVARDIRNQAALAAGGWTVLVVWECEISAQQIEKVIAEIKMTKPKVKK